jgi:hypothetical protein
VSSFNIGGVGRLSQNDYKNIAGFLYQRNGWSISNIANDCRSTRR